MPVLAKDTSGKPKEFTKPSSSKPQPPPWIHNHRPTTDVCNPGTKLTLSKPQSKSPSVKPRRKIPVHKETSITEWEMLGKKCEPAHRGYVTFKPPLKGIGGHPRDLRN